MECRVVSEGNARVIFKELVVFMLCHRGEKVIHHGRKRSQNVIIEGFVLFYGGWGRTNMPLCMENYGEPVFLFSILLLPSNIMSERQTQIFTRREPRFHALCDQ